jgi:hypothetical protein
MSLYLDITPSNASPSYPFQSSVSTDICRFWLGYDSSGHGISAIHAYQHGMFSSLRKARSRSVSQRTNHIVDLINTCPDHTLFPDNDEHTSADLNSLGTIILEMMDETRESLKSTAGDWSADTVNFVEATSCATPDELSDVSFPNLQFGSLLRLASTFL